MTQTRRHVAHTFKFSLIIDKEEVGSLSVNRVVLVTFTIKALRLSDLWNFLMSPQRRCVLTTYIENTYL